MRIFLVSAGLVSAALGAILVYWLIRLWFPTPPRPPTAAEMSGLESRFPALRETLERVALAYQEGHLRAGRDTLSSPSPASRHDRRPEDQVLRHEQDVRARVQGLWMRPQPVTLDIAQSDSLIYIAAWSRRGYGFSAPLNAAGYVYASRDPGDRSAWPVSGSGHLPDVGFPVPGRYQHLDGRWYLYSIRQW